MEPRFHRPSAILRTVTVLLLALALWPLGCATPLPSKYLQDEVKNANKDEILVKFGEPRSRKDLPDGGEVWTYRYIRTSVLGTGVVGKRICTEYHLTFDNEDNLRDWQEQPC